MPAPVKATMRSAESIQSRRVSRISAAARCFAMIASPSLAQLHTAHVLRSRRLIGACVHPDGPVQCLLPRSRPALLYGERTSRRAVCDSRMSHARGGVGLARDVRERPLLERLHGIA